jgi:mannose/cellobiose epimerase-like protein (N-acyl-D-glucosamine 2-epimerase family)
VGSGWFLSRTTFPIPPSQSKRLSPQGYKPDIEQINEREYPWHITGIVRVAAKAFPQTQRAGVRQAIALIAGAPRNTAGSIRRHEQQQLRWPTACAVRAVAKLCTRVSRSTLTTWTTARIRTAMRTVTDQPAPGSATTPVMKRQPGMFRTVAMTRAVIPRQHAYVACIPAHGEEMNE